MRDLESDDKFIDYCRKYVLHGTPYIFLNREDEYYEFRKRIANKFKVAFNEVFITGSAKMGFSWFKEKQFDYDSDIDVAIVSNRLYEEILESIRYYHIDLGEFNVFSDSEFTRMADLHFILLIMATLESGGYFARDKEIETYIARFNDEYSRSNHTKALIIKTFAVIKDLDLSVDSIWFRKSNFFTLVVELAKHNVNISENFRERLIHLEENILKNKNNKDNEFGEYYGYMYGGTNYRKVRVERANIFNKYVYDETISGSSK